MKEHKSHDVLLLCASCHQRSNLHDSQLKQSLMRRVSLDASDKTNNTSSTTTATTTAAYNDADFYITSLRSAAKSVPLSL